ncbi:polysaccharide pyruvyl transferase family protein [Mesorhizobium sp. B2-3-12]|uniref:polysaccharide pyruvyl transferase family protein n=1 Tax=Mesorhizobium sp. B2-3-12 TaxID=2589952 RepID=UPI0011264266|nr:polysaccharide pyruvyl transferase family protein [Mesorhizobium sp. B2-3-12]TPL80671.1 glycosyltransferase [Mesorhizobium sp. B2-3-12]
MKPNYKSRIHRFLLKTVRGGSGGVKPTQSDVAIREWHFSRIGNIGDVVSPDVIEHASRQRTIFSTDSNQARLFAIGSIAGSANSRTILWGTGLMDPDQQVSQILASNVYALRGKLTHQRFKSAGVDVPDIPLGDPGFLVPDFLPRISSEQKFRMGLIPHYVDRQHPLFQRLLREEGVVDVNVHDSPTEFFRTLQSCDAIVSSSLHGLIFAEAFGIPNLWIKLSDRVVRSGFKFRDWFSLANQPQNQPYEPAIDIDANELVARATLHDVQIDRAAMISNFPNSRIGELSHDLGKRSYQTLSSCRKMPLPIFVISYNRGKFLRAAIDSYRKMKRSVEVIVHDNGSDDPETLHVLDDLESEGCIIYKRGKIFNQDELNNVDETIKDYFSSWAQPTRYVVTDCDIDLSAANADALDVYDELLDRYTSVQCVGPMIRIRDVPHDYPLFQEVMNRHIEQFWHRKPEWVETSHGRVASIDVLIDTTFALHRAGEPFSRMKTARRVYYPFEAAHLDWYLKADDYSSSAYFETSSAAISHWNNMAADKLATDGPTEFGHFIYVDTDANGVLVERTQFVDQGAPTP